MSLRAAVSDTGRLFRSQETSFSAVLAVGAPTADAPLAFPGRCSPDSVRFPCRCPRCSRDFLSLQPVVAGGEVASVPISQGVRRMSFSV
jgi:hypothetical protein